MHCIRQRAIRARTKNLSPFLTLGIALGSSSNLLIMKLKLSWTMPLDEYHPITYCQKLWIVFDSCAVYSIHPLPITLWQWKLTDILVWMATHNFFQVICLTGQYRCTCMCYPYLFATLFRGSGGIFFSKQQCKQKAMQVLRARKKSPLVVQGFLV